MSEFPDNVPGLSVLPWRRSRSIVLVKYKLAALIDYLYNMYTIPFHRWLAFHPALGSKDHFTNGSFIELRTFLAFVHKTMAILAAAAVKVVHFGLTGADGPFSQPSISIIIKLSLL